LLTTRKVLSLINLKNNIINKLSSYIAFFGSENFSTQNPLLCDVKYFMRKKETFKHCFMLYVLENCQFNFVWCVSHMNTLICFCSTAASVKGKMNKFIETINLGT